MRTFISIVVAIHYLIASTICHADQMDDAIAKLDGFKKVLETSFQPFLLSSTESAVKSQHLQLFFDHLTVQKLLAERSAKGILRIQSLSNQLKGDVAKMASNGSDFEASASNALAIVSQAQDIQNDAEKVQEDALMLQDSWSTQCSTQRIDDLANQVGPLYTVEIMDPGSPNIPHIGAEYDIHISQTFNEDGSNAGANQNVGQNSDFHDTKSSLNSAGGIAMTVGIGLCFTPLIVVGIILIIVAVILLIAGAMFDASKQANQEQKIADKRNEIYAVQDGAIRQVQGLTPGIIRQSCDSSFPQASIPKLSLEIYSNYLKQAQQFYIDAKAKRDDIVKLYTKRLQDLNTNYFPLVEKVYMDLVQKRFEQDQNLEVKIQTVEQNELTPLLQKYLDMKKIGGTSLWQAQQKIWDNLIENDAVYRTRSEFSFIKAKAPTVPTFDNSWNDFGPSLISKGILQ